MNAPAPSPFHLIDWILVASYLLIVFAIGFFAKKGEENMESFLLSDRKLTYPAFVATLVSTWYGGILGVGEFTYGVGIAQWFVFGLPYYLFAIAFAFILVPNIRKMPHRTIPETLHAKFGILPARIGALSIAILSSPAPYLLITAVLFSWMTGTRDWLWLWIIVAGMFSLFYTLKGGFSAVTRTDVFQVILMFAGFIILDAFALFEIGGFSRLMQQLPASKLQPDGGLPLAEIAVWFFIALWTFVDPGFHQRVAAASSVNVARKGILSSVAFWFLFDMLTLSAGLSAIVLLPGLEQPLQAYPDLATKLLPPALLGLFAVALLATVMSTTDSFLFISGITLGADLKLGTATQANPRHIRIGMATALFIAWLLIAAFPSVIDLWFAIGSVMIPVLLLPVLASYFPKLAPPRSYVLLSMGGSLLSGSLWLVISELQTQTNTLFQQIPAFYVGLFVSGICFLTGIFRQEND